MLNSRLRRCFRPLGLASAVALFTATPASAFQFQIGDNVFRIENLFTVGAMLRMQDRDISNIGKSNLDPGLCVARVGDDGVSGPDTTRGNNTFSGDTCTTSNGVGGDPALSSASNIAFVNAPGSFTPNADNGNLNFDKGDVVHAAAKITTDFNTELYGFNIFARSLLLFDSNYDDLLETHPDTTLQARRTEFPEAGKDVISVRTEFLDYNISRSFDVFDRFVSVKVGNQVLNWGESSFLLANSLNSINPADQALLRIPGFDLKELQQPQGMVVINAELLRSVNLEMFYQYEWKPVIVDPVGSFFSQSDTLGEGGQYAMLSFSKAPEDPGIPTNDPRYPAGFIGLYVPSDNPNDPIGSLGSNASRTIYRDLAEERRREPEDGGQYGAALKFFLENFNGGTEVGLYFANYHARVPSISGFSALETCIPADTGAAATNLAAFGAACTSAGREPIPVDTARLIVEYPEDIRMYGMSFNTTLGGYAISGEYAWRENLPIQAQSTDLVFALLQPAFPTDNFDVGAAVIPGRRAAVPDFLETNYRNNPFVPGSGGNEYIRGWEPMKIGQANLTFLRLLGGGDNPFGASQMTILFEMGYTHLPDYPDLSEFQSNGAGTDTHISVGADGTTGINPRDIRLDPNDPNSFDPAKTLPGLRQNPTSQLGLDVKGFGTKESYGYRLLTLTRFDNSLFGANIELLNAFFHDIEGVGPGLGQNFVEGRKQILSGIRFDYLSRYVGELRYTWFTGGQNRDALRDRDNVFLQLGYQF
ncbi:MAG: DUF1302 domain-containing protein [Gammaproteobacteria bacterium]